jgi:hypothetical protein
VHTQDWLKPNLMNHWFKGMWPPSSPDYKPLDYFVWSEVEREVNKQPHNTLASLKVKISEVLTNIEREIFILHCQRFWSQIEAIVEASGDLILKMCMQCVYKLFLKFSLKYIHPITIYFIVLNVSYEFVLIYRPHPVYLNMRYFFFFNGASIFWAVVLYCA